MAYTTKDLVKAMFRGLNTGASGSVITDAKLDDWIAQQDAYINGRLAQYYSTPIDPSASPISSKILELVSTYKVAHMVKTVLEVTVQNSDKVQEVQTNLDKKADKMLDEMLPSKDAPPKLKLPDAVVLGVSPDVAVMNLQARGGTFTKGGNNW